MMCLNADGSGKIVRIGVQAQACAIGQAAAAIFAQNAAGKSGPDIVLYHAAIASWLNGEAPTPQWEGFASLERAKAYPARHDTILLPWKAAAAALCKDGASR